ncbi:MAG TPA: hypothetical protein VE077_18145 [Candidatus Methylomirabilis sp.]|nr:hypothetical protein [Candidatus Methylomirabilis sp.]
MKQAAKAPLKKPYTPPKLTTYGDLTEMTQFMRVMMGMFDNKARTRKT